MGEVGKKLFETDKSLFKGFGPKEWIKYYESLNAEIPVDECRLKMTENEKKCYVEDLEFLKRERKHIPGVKYEVNYRDLE